jgi:hypothetical protein
LAVTCDPRTGEIHAYQAAVSATHFDFWVEPRVKIFHLCGVVSTSEELRLPSKIWHDFLDILTNKIVDRVAGHVGCTLVQVANDALIIDHGDSAGHDFEDVVGENRMIFEVPHSVLSFIDTSTNNSMIS